MLVQSFYTAFFFFCLLRLLRIEGQHQLLKSELVDLRERKKQREEELRTNGGLQESAVSDRKPISDVR